MSAPQIRLTVTLRWRDMDMLGHLNQAVYHELLEEARGALVASLGDGATVHDTYVLVHVELDYHHEVRKDHGSVDVLARVSHVGTSSLTMEHEILLPDGTVAAAGRTVMVGWDMARRAKRELGEAERRRLAPDAAP